MLPLLVAVAALVSGGRTLFFRDIFNLHLPAKLAQAAAWREGVLPLVDPFRAGGQPSLGNANTLPLYPDNLLYLVADELWALNAHFWLHLLLAPAAAYWLGRAFGLSRPAAWAVGGTYALSGAYLSQAGFYNLVPGATIAPALVAAALRTSVPPSPGEGEAFCRMAKPAMALCALWCLLLLGGDPMLAAQALGAAVLAVVLRGGPRARKSERPPHALRAGARLLPALGAGTLLALPQLAGLLQILPFSYRGYIGFADESSLVASWDPRQFLEWLLPLAFGSPELGFWGEAFSGGDLPLFFSVHPGLLTLGLVLAAGLPRNRAAWWGWATVAVGIFLALGSWNPLVRLLVHLPGAELLRFPAKFFLLVSLGLALLAGIGLERALREGGRPLVRALGGVLLAMLVLLAVLVQTPEWVERWLVAAGDISEHQSTIVRARWLAGAVVQAFLALALVVAALGLKRRPAIALTLLLGLHSVSQVLWLRAALLPTDETSAYRGRPPLFEHLRGDETLVHGGFANMFGTARSGGLPDRRLLWVQRRGFLELYPFAGVGLGLRYELNVSAEGLDSFLSNLSLKVMRRLDDAQRLRGLRALGVEALVLDRPLTEPLPAWVELRTEMGSIGGRAFLYGLEGAPDLVVAGTVLRSPNVNTTISRVIDSRFDPTTMAVVPGDGAVRDGPPGRVLQLTVWEPERIEAVVEAQGPSVLVLQRAYLPFFRAEIDGRPARLTVANLDRLALELPAGEHEVRIWADRRPLRWSLLGPAAGVLWLVAVGAGWRWKPPGSTSPSRQPAADAGE